MNFRKKDGESECDHSCDYLKISDQDDRVWCFKVGDYDYQTYPDKCPMGTGGTSMTMPSHGSGTSPSHGPGSGTSPSHGPGSGTSPSHGPGSGTSPSHGTDFTGSETSPFLGTGSTGERFNYSYYLIYFTQECLPMVHTDQ